MGEPSDSQRGYFDYNPRDETYHGSSRTSSVYSSIGSEKNVKVFTTEQENGRRGSGSQYSSVILSPPELRRESTGQKRPHLLERLKSAQSVTRRQLSHEGLIRENSVFGRQSLANVRLEDAMGKRKTPATIWLIILTSALTFGLHGVSNSVTNGIITDKTFIKQFPQTDDVDTTGSMKTNNSTIQGVTVGMYQVGCALGAFMCYFLNNRFGRKPTIHLLGILSCIGIIIQVTSFSLAQLIVGRTIMGLGVGMGHATFPLYLAESVSSQIRGRAIIACAVAGNFGHFVGAAMEIGFYFVKESTQWRMPIGLELIWAAASAVLPFWCPESPRFLLSMGKYNESIVSQSKLAGLPITDPVVIEEVNALEDALHEAHADAAGSSPPARRFYRAALAVFIQIMSSMSGIDVITFFSTQTFNQQLHFSPLISRVLTMGLQACQWLFSIIAIFAIDTLGRRPLLLACAALMAISMGCLFGLTGADASPSMLQSAILFYFFTLCAYPLGYHLIPSMYVAELSPGATRHQVTALTGGLHFLFDFLVTLITPIAFSAINSRYYIVYMCTNILTFAVVFFCFPETKGLELETIDEVFELAPSYSKIVPYAAERGALAKQLALDLKSLETS